MSGERTAGQWAPAAFARDWVARRPWAGRVYRTGHSAIGRLINHGGLELSGHLSFTALLSLFPFLLFLASLAGYMGDAETAQQFIRFLFDFTPKDVASTLAPALFEVLTSRQGGLLTVGALGTLWAASSGVEALRLALNRAYDVDEPRPFWWLRLQSIAIVIGASVAILVSSASVVFGPFLWDLFQREFGVRHGEWAWTLVRYAVACLFLTAMLVTLHRLLPSRTRHIRSILPGVAATLVMWIVTSTLFSLYLGTIADYGSTYGALGGVAITLMFFYFAAIAFILGAELNALLTGIPPAPPDPHRPA